MKSLILKFEKYFCNGNLVLRVFLFHLLIMLSIVMVLIFYFNVNTNFFLEDDGYYNLGKLFFHGKIGLTNQYIGPGLPLIMSVINIFPEKIHFLVRIIFTELFTLGNIYLVYKIFNTLINKREIFWGLITGLFNPLYLRFILKPVIEIYVAFFLGLVIYSLIFYERKRIIMFLLLLLVLFVGTYFKPIFLFIPFGIFLFALTTKYKNYLLLSGILLLFIMITFYSFINFTKIKEPGEGLYTTPYGTNDFIASVFFIQAIHQTNNISLGSKLIEVAPLNSNIYLARKYTIDWKDNYHKLGGSENLIIMNSEFILQKFGSVIIAKLLAPVFFISLSDTFQETIIHLFINIFILLIAYRSIKKLYRYNKKQILLIVIILFSYASIFFITFSYVRYSLPFIFYMSIFTGHSICGWLKIQ